MAAVVIDGRSLADKMIYEVKKKIENLKSNGKRSPCLTVVLIGNDAASQVYVRHKVRACERVGIKSEVHRLNSDISEKDLIVLIEGLNSNNEIDGILIQLPLPSHINSFHVLSTIKANKDVDGLSPHNQGLLAMGKEGHVPCTPKGIMFMLESLKISLAGKRACVIGRSLLVGFPIATLLMRANATVTIIHSKTQNAKALSKEADILIVAAGKHHLVDETWVKKDAVVIDVGIHKVNGKLTGDVLFDRVKESCGFVSPVPGGVGPLTVSSLLQNCLNALAAS